MGLVSRPWNGLCRSVRGSAFAHVLLDHGHNSIRVVKIARSHHSHVLRPVPALVEGKHLAGGDALDDVLFAYRQALCILPGSGNQPQCIARQTSRRLVLPKKCANMAHHTLESVLTAPVPKKQESSLMNS